MENYQVELQTIYKQISDNTLINCLIGLGIFIGIICFVIKIVKAFNGSADKDYKVIWETIKTYVFMTAFICIFPFVLNKIEYLLGIVQNDLANHFNSSVEMTAGQYVKNEITNYVTDKSKDIMDIVGDPIGFVTDAMAINFNIFLLQINKYLYFIFCASRYLWLIMLEIVSPIAIFCYLNEETRKYFFSWLKNMFICYLLIPFFLLADVFAESVIKLLAENDVIFSFSSYSTLALLGMLVLKISLYKVASNRAFKLID